MAFSKAAMVLIGTGNGQNLYLYKSADAIATIAGAGYFNSFFEQLGEGDVILAVGSLGGTETVDALVVQSASSSAVSVANGT